MAHRAAGRCRAAGDEADHRLLAALLGFVLEELCRVFFGRTADLADHDDRLGFVVGKEHFQDVDEFGALDRVAADADSRRLAETFIGGLEHGFIGQRAGTRENADGALLEDGARHDADLAFVRGQNARAVRPDQARLRLDQTILDLDHVGDRNAFRDADDERDFGFDRFEDRSRSACRRHVDDRSVGAGGVLALGNGLEDRQLFAVLAGPGFTTLGRVDTADHLRAVIGKSLFSVEGAGLAGQALNQNLGVFVDENRHARPLLREVGRRGGNATIDAADDLLPCIAAGGRESDAHAVAVFIFELKESALRTARRDLGQDELVVDPLAGSRRGGHEAYGIELIELVSLVRRIEAENVPGFERCAAVPRLHVALFDEKSAEQTLGRELRGCRAFLRPGRSRDALFPFPGAGKSTEAEMSSRWSEGSSHPDQPLTAFTIFWAASSRSSAEMTLRPDSLMIFLPSSTLVPSRRTTSGTFRPTSLTAASTPSAMTSHFMMPPKMLTRMPWTAGSAVMILKAAVTFSLVAPPPTSRKFAGSAP
ncbi:hypothetical protein RHSP_59733 [Rhizobium freirei PRF 81]|uniref:Uncharacterized protein n=1 Tax=Rhizobium freirei PRF 81 TaxID=363754 RepID=N6V723_9HYPH|nr:hypothetical protein RHSP_59733 [Rhizobium freirei PRF 81]